MKIPESFSKEVKNVFEIMPDDLEVTVKIYGLSDVEIRYSSLNVVPLEDLKRYLGEGTHVDLGVNGPIFYRNGLIVLSILYDPEHEIFYNYINKEI